MEQLIFLLLSHLIYDFHLQGDVGKLKRKSTFILFIHALTWGLVLSAVLIYFENFAIWKLVFLIVTHFLIDRWKIKLPKSSDYFWAVYIDQCLHLISIVVVLMF